MPTDEEIKRLAGHPDCIPPQYIEWFLKGYRVGENDKGLVNPISLNNILADSLPLSDEEIEKEAEKRYGEVMGGSYHAARPMDKARFIKGAKWVRDFKR